MTTVCVNPLTRRHAPVRCVDEVRGGCWEMHNTSATRGTTVPRRTVGATSSFDAEWACILFYFVHFRYRTMYSVGEKFRQDSSDESSSDDGICSLATPHPSLNTPIVQKTTPFLWIFGVCPGFFPWTGWPAYYALCYRLCVVVLVRVRVVPERSHWVCAHPPSRFAVSSPNALT